MNSSNVSPIPSHNTESEHYLQQLESTILYAASTGSPDSSHRLDIERCQSPDGLAGACLDLLRRRGWGVTDYAAQQFAKGGISCAQFDAVAFYALTTLQRSPLLACLPPTNGSSDNTNATQQNINLSLLRNQLRLLLLTTISHCASLQTMPTFVSTKVGVLLALLVLEDYPMNWASPWTDILGALSVHTGRMGNLSEVNTTDGSSNISVCENVASQDMYLRFLDCISDEIVYPAADNENNKDSSSSSSLSSNSQYISTRRDQVKDVLRGFTIDSPNNQQGVQEPSIPLENTDAAQIIGWLLDAITTNATTNYNNGATGGEFEQEKRKVAVRAAATLKRYLSWVDLRLAAHPNLVQCLLQGLGGASAGNPSSNATTDDLDDAIIDEDDIDATPGTLLAVECALCLREIITRGMDESKKVALLHELNIFGTVCRLAGFGNSATNGTQGKLDLTNPDATQIDAVIAAAELINTAGLEFIPCWELEYQTASTNVPSSHPVNVIMNQCLELALGCLAYDDIDVSGGVVDLVTRMLVSLEKNEPFWNNTLQNNGEIPSDRLLQRLLSILQERMKYPSSFDFDYEDEDEAEEEVYRTHLRKLYQRIVRFKPQMVLHFMAASLSSLPQPLSMVSTSDMEVALRLVHHYGEGRRPAPGAKTALRDAQFREMVTALHRSDVSSHPHREVLLLYYDLSVRYASLLKDSPPELLSGLLGALSGDRGLQHPHARVRSRCCYLLLRLVKSVGAKAMRPYVEVVVDGIQRLLFPSTNILQLPANEALYLFEITGTLLGTTGLDNEVQQRCATAVLTPHVQSIEKTLQSPDLARDVEQYGEQLSMSISAIAQLSKGWQNHPPPEVQAVLVAAVDVCRSVLVALPSSPLVRNRTAVLLQRMILCLGERVLPTMPAFLDALLSHCSTEEDVLDVSQLLNQLCIKFKENAAPAIDVALLPFLQKVLTMQLSETSVVPTASCVAPPPHLVTEQLSIRKQAFATLQHIATHNASAVFFSERNVGSFGDILSLMNDGATTVPDPVMKKTCVVYMSELVQQWGGTNSQPCPVPQNVKDGFFDFICEVFVPGMLRCILDSSFNAKDALHYRVLSEFSNVLWLLKQSSAEFQSRVMEAFVLGGSDTGVIPRGSPNIASGLQNASSGKEMESYLKAWKEEVVSHR